MDISSWISNLPSSNNWPESDSQLVLQLATSIDSTKTILLKADPNSGSNTEALATFSISLHGFFYPSTNPDITIWVSNPCPLGSALFPLLLQLIQETIARAPTAQDSIITPFKLDPEPVSRALGSTSPDPSFFNLAFLCRLFWLCVCDAPAEAGSLFFQTLAPNLYTFLQCKPYMSAFLAAIGADGELLLMRSLGYMLAKWFILRDVGGLSLIHSTAHKPLGFSYARESHGQWVLKGYVPVAAMSRTSFNNQHDRKGILDVKESVLRYALAHQQLEVVIQLEHSVCFHEGFIRVGVRLDNLRIHVTRLGFGQSHTHVQEQEQIPYADERHIPSRVRVWVGPEAGSAWASSLTLGRSTDNPEREVETRKTVKGSFGKSNSPKVKARASTGVRSRIRDWRWEQEAEGNTAVFEGVLCKDENGAELDTWRGGIGMEKGPKSSIGRKRWYVVFAGDEYGEEVSWRMGREMEGGDLKWRLGGKVWLSYWPYDFKMSYYETRCVEWSEEVTLPVGL